MKLYGLAGCVLHPVNFVGVLLLAYMSGGTKVAYASAVVWVVASIIFLSKGDK